MKATAVDKFFRDVVRHHVGETPNEKNDLVTVYDPIYPMSGARLQPGPKSPICGKCDLHSHNAVAPYLGPIGDQDPLITFVLEGISPKEDEAGPCDAPAPGQRKPKRFRPGQVDGDHQERAPRRHERRET